MGHDIYLINNGNETISQVRFTKWDRNADLFYDLFDAGEYNGGVSGIGGRVTLSLSSMKKASKKYKQLDEKGFYQFGNPEIGLQQKKEILEFIKNGTEVAQKEGNVFVLFA